MVVILEPSVILHYKEYFGRCPVVEIQNELKYYIKHNNQRFTQKTFWVRYDHEVSFQFEKHTDKYYRIVGIKEE